MKKVLVPLFTAALCAVLLCGCRMSVRPSVGLSSFRYDHAEQYTGGGAILTDVVERVEIHWLSGSVAVQAHGEDTISFSEEANRELTKDDCLYYRLDGTTLLIQFCRSGKWDLNGLEKDLTVLLPEELLLKDLEIDSVSAEIAAQGVGTEAANLNTISGDIRLTDCIITKLAELDTVSGAVATELTQPLDSLYAGTVSGHMEVTAPEIGAFHGDTTSGAVSLAVDAAPRELDIDTVSGDVTLHLPEEADFALEVDTVSGDFSSELPCAKKDGRYVCGSGTGVYEIDTTSGDIRMQRGGV